MKFLVLLSSSLIVASSAFTATTLQSTLSTTSTTTCQLYPNSPSISPSSSSSSFPLWMAKRDDEDLLRYSKQTRSAGVNDRVVELVRPLGVVLNEDSQGNVYVETVAPKGNAARSGMVKEGDVVTMCSATFGDQMWSTRGVGLSRVLAAIRVRAGATVKLALERPNETKRKVELSTQQRQAAEQARIKAQEKKDKLLKELEKDEVKLKKGKFLGLF